MWLRLCRQSALHWPLRALRPEQPTYRHIRSPVAMASPKSAEERAAAKEAKKQAKAAKRAKREGALPAGSKQCDLCHQLKDMLIRCQIDEAGKWHMVCTKCWPSVSGGVEDGDDQHPHYRYGGMWKNKSASSTATSAKKPK